MNYSQAMQYMLANLPMFQRVGAAAYKPDLKNTIEICRLIGNPQQRFRSIHIAGTNGKGSVSHMLAAIFMAAGYKTGLYTSPHLTDFRERIKINGTMIPKKTVSRFVTTYQNDFAAIKPSFFEMTVGMAFEYFANQEVDIAIIETGLGGRLDSTNVIIPELSIITNISFDHRNLLGNTLRKIAKEKAGIIKKGIPVVVGEHQPETDEVFTRKARKEKAPLIFASDIYRIKPIYNEYSLESLTVFKGAVNIIKSLKPSLKGRYQVKNIHTVLAATKVMLTRGWKISPSSVATGISRTTELTGLKGRWQILETKPLTIADCGHNTAGIKEIIAQLNTINYHTLHWVLGLVADKDITDILKLLPESARYYFCEARIPRALNRELLRREALKFNLRGECYPSVKKALEAAEKNAIKRDLILIGGSTFVVAEVV